jgi:Flp pilus assembly protein TadD
MSNRFWKLIVLIPAIAGLGISTVWARDVRVTVPQHSEATPVQRLNREGVEAVRKHQYEKAEALFYKAYLYDAADPFTLNNLGYISELQGKLDRAQKFYALASQQGSEAVIDLSNAKELQGKPMTYAWSGLKDVPMQVNRMNVEAIGLLSQQRNFEADALLQKALALDPKNPFTLNNLGVAEEATGNFPDALKYYDAAAAARSSEPIVVTTKFASRGKPVSQMAATSAKELRHRIRNLSPAETRATMLTLRGVAATNRNDWDTAKKDFLQAYALDPQSAFSLNNLGYLAERNGDLETAQYYYSKALKADGSHARIGLATQSSAEGQHLLAVAADNGQKVDSELEQYAQAQRNQTGPVELLRRDNTPVNTGTPAKPANAAPHPSTAQPTAPSTQQQAPAKPDAGSPSPH